MDQVRHADVTLPLPLGWEDGSQIAILGPSNGQFRPNIVVSKERLKADETFDQFIVQIKRSLREVLENYQICEEGRATIGKWSGYMLEQTFTNSDGRPSTILQQQQFFLIVGETVYTFTCSNTADAFDATRAEIKKIISGAHIRGLSREIEAS